MTSSRLKQAAYSAFTSEVLLPLVTIFGDGVETLRIVPNTEPVISGGETFNPFPMTIQLPDEAGDGVPIMKFTVSAIGREVIQRLRLVPDALFVTVAMVLASHPDTVELSFPTMRLRNVDFEAQTVSGDLILGDFLTESVPKHSFTPGFFPAAFKG